MILTLMFFLNLSFQNLNIINEETAKFINSNNIKEFIYEHKKYNIEENFKNTTIKLETPKNLNYSFNLKSIKKQNNNTLETSFKGNIVYTENNIQFKDLKQFNKINKKEYKNKKIKKLEKKKYKSEFKNGFLNLKEDIDFLSYFTKKLLFFQINKLPEALIVGKLWSENNEKIIQINKTDYTLIENKYIKFLGYKNKSKILKVTYFFKLNNFLTKELKNYGVSEIIIEVKDDFINKISVNMQINNNENILDTIKFEKSVKTIEF